MVDETQSEEPLKVAPDEGRRDFLKSLATVPLLGAMAYGIYKKVNRERVRRNVSDVFKLEGYSPQILPIQRDGKKLRLGMIGFGIRGKLLLRSCGFAEPEYIEKLKEEIGGV